MLDFYEQDVLKARRLGHVTETPWLGPSQGDEYTNRFR
jgi:hypothetical protein